MRIIFQIDIFDTGPMHGQLLCSLYEPPKGSVATQTKRQGVLARIKDEHGVSRAKVNSEVIVFLDI